MLYFYPLWYAAVLLKFTYYARTGIVVRLLCFYMQFCIKIHYMQQTVLYRLFYQSILMKGIKVYHYALLYDDCSIRVYLSIIFLKCLILLLISILHFPIMLALCLILSMTHYAQNYAVIIGGSLLHCNHDYFIRVIIIQPTSLIMC